MVRALKGQKALIVWLLILGQASCAALPMPSDGIIDGGDLGSQQVSSENEEETMGAVTQESQDSLGTRAAESLHVPTGNVVAPSAAFANAEAYASTPHQSAAFAPGYGAGFDGGYNSYSSHQSQQSSESRSTTSHYTPYGATHFSQAEAQAQATAGESSCIGGSCHSTEHYNQEQRSETTESTEGYAHTQSDYDVTTGMNSYGECGCCHIEVCVCAASCQSYVPPAPMPPPVAPVAPCMTPPCVGGGISQESVEERLHREHIETTRIAEEAPIPYHEPYETPYPYSYPPPQPAEYYPPSPPYHETIPESYYPPPPPPPPAPPSPPPEYYPLEEYLPYDVPPEYPPEMYQPEVYAPEYDYPPEYGYPPVYHEESLPEVHEEGYHSPIPPPAPAPIPTAVPAPAPVPAPVAEQQLYVEVPEEQVLAEQVVPTPAPVIAQPAAHAVTQQEIIATQTPVVTQQSVIAPSGVQAPVVEQAIVPPAPQAAIVEQPLPAPAAPVPIPVPTPTVSQVVTKHGEIIAQPGIETAHITTPIAGPEAISETAAGIVPGPEFIPEEGGFMPGGIVPEEVGFMPEGGFVPEGEGFAPTAVTPMPGAGITSETLQETVVPEQPFGPVQTGVTEAQVDVGVTPGFAPQPEIVPSGFIPPSPGMIPPGEEMTEEAVFDVPPPITPVPPQPGVPCLAGICVICKVCPLEMQIRPWLGGGPGFMPGGVVEVNAEAEALGGFAPPPAAAPVPPMPDAIPPPVGAPFPPSSGVPPADIVEGEAIAEETAFAGVPPPVSPGIPIAPEMPIETGMPPPPIASPPIATGMPSPAIAPPPIETGMPPPAVAPPPIETGVTAGEVLPPIAPGIPPTPPPTPVVETAFNIETSSPVGPGPAVMAGAPVPIPPSPIPSPGIAAQGAAIATAQVQTEAAAVPEVGPGFAPAPDFPVSETLGAGFEEPIGGLPPMAPPVDIPPQGYAEPIGVPAEASVTSPAMVPPGIPPGGAPIPSAMPPIAPEAEITAAGSFEAEGMPPPGFASGPGFGPGPGPGFSEEIAAEAEAEAFAAGEAGMTSALASPLACTLGPLTEPCPQPDGFRCGPSFAMARCPEGTSCSMWGYCGVTIEHRAPATCLYQCDVSLSGGVCDGWAGFGVINGLIQVYQAVTTCQAGLTGGPITPLAY